eukprot:364414-Chlamydomonas_euryale.AAC.8
MHAALPPTHMHTPRLPAPARAAGCSSRPGWRSPPRTRCAAAAGLPAPSLPASASPRSRCSGAATPGTCDKHE